MKKLVQKLLLVLSLVVGLTAVLPTTAQAQCRTPVRVVRFVGYQTVAVYVQVRKQLPCGKIVTENVFVGYAQQAVYSY